MNLRRSFARLRCALVAACGVAVAAPAQTPSTAAAAPSRAREFRPGSITRPEDLPAGAFRQRVEGLPEAARRRAIAWLGNLHLPEQDFAALRVDSQGGVYYADPAGEHLHADHDHDHDAAEVPADTAPASTEPAVARAALPVAPFPASLVFHSRPGAPNVLFLNFAGETVTGTAWNTSEGVATYEAVAFSSDSDFATFSDAEQLAIRRVWQRVAEDYAAFNIDVTTERPASFNNRTAMALITRTTDANGVDNPASGSGGVAYVNVFAQGNYATYRPAWIYADNFGYNEAFIAEAASHEVGHNMGLSHDGKTDGTDYYSGHGSGEISWGPIMGTGYNRNVSQWSKGEYYLANNTQDDLALIAAKLGYRTDDHGDSAGSATALVVTDGTNVVATTPETDPINASPVNKGVLEDGTDADWFSFVTGSGPVVLTATPWVSPANSRGGNVDLQLELYAESGALVTSTNPASQTGARIATVLAEGLYHLKITGSGAGTPEASSPSGYTAYGSLGQYFLGGQLVPTSYVAPPQAEATLAGLTRNGVEFHEIRVTYSDNLAVDVSSIDGADVRITGPNGYDQMAALLSVDQSANGTPVVALYGAPAPNGVAWSPADNGDYEVTLLDGAVDDTEGSATGAKTLGTFTVAVPLAVYSAYMDSDPGWTYAGLWAYGTPGYSAGLAAPASGFTGSRIVAFNLTGNYPNSLAATHVVTPAIDCANARGLTLRFQRWLRLRNRDTASIGVSTNGTVWTTVWTTTNPVADTAWQEVQYALPSWIEGSRNVRLRWSLASGTTQNDIGWNLDDVEVLAGGSLDTVPPSAVLGVANLVDGSAQAHVLSVTYTDEAGIRVGSIGAGDLLVTGPNGDSNLVALAAVDLPDDGSPRVASYTVAPPGGSWDAADNGDYTVALLEGEVTDIHGNPVPAAVLGQFTVAIPETLPMVTLTASSSDPAAGSVSPESTTVELGAEATVTALPTAYFRFVAWSGDVASTNNPLTLTLGSNTTVRADFAEMLTTNRATPLWWLALHGITENFETAEEATGANGHAFWQSYVAGLDPDDPASQLRLRAVFDPLTASTVLDWDAVTGRTYTVWSSTNVLGPFVPAATNGSGRFTPDNAAPAPALFYRLGVDKP